jgi:carboxyl-terminal processing protease
MRILMARAMAVCTIFFLLLPIAASADELTIMQEDRIMGLVQLYTEAKYNFVYWDRVPDLDWDASFVAFLPKVEGVSSDYEYYRVLQSFYAQLCDGHTYVRFPDRLTKLMDWPPLKVNCIEGRTMVTEVADIEELRETGLVVGAEILSVDSTPVNEYLARDVLPYGSASTEHARQHLAREFMLYGWSGTTVELGLRLPSGEETAVEVERNSMTIPREKRPLVFWEFPSVVYRDLGDGLHYFAINNMTDSDAPERFREQLLGLRDIEGLVLDLRNNWGGSSEIAFSFAGTLIDEPMPMFRFSTPCYRPAEFGWNGKQLGDEWHEYPTQTIDPAGDDHYGGPVVVLTGPLTGSAAEDFLVPLDAADRITIIGQSTAGSTGNPVIIQLPGGGHAGICSVKDVYPDGREFVGFGIKPDIKTEPMIAGLLAGEDEALQRAIQFLETSR